MKKTLAVMFQTLGRTNPLSSQIYNNSACSAVSSSAFSATQKTEIKTNSDDEGVGRTFYEAS